MTLACDHAQTLSLQQDYRSGEILWCRRCGALKAYAADWVYADLINDMARNNRFEAMISTALIEPPSGWQPVAAGTLHARPFQTLSSTEKEELFDQWRGSETCAHVTSLLWVKVRRRHVTP